MSRRYNLRRIKQHECYTALELAALLKVNLVTVRRWSMEGLRPIDQRRPFLFLGEHVADFLRARMPPQIKLAPGELLCVRCNAARFGGDFRLNDGGSDVERCHEPALPAEALAKEPDHPVYRFAGGLTLFVDKTNCEHAMRRFSVRFGGAARHFHCFEPVAEFPPQRLEAGGPAE